MYDNALSGGSVFLIFVHLYPKGLEAMAKMYQLVAVVLFQHLPEIVSRCLQCSVMTLCKLVSCCLQQQHHMARHSAAMRNMALTRPNSWAKQVREIEWGPFTLDSTTF